MTPSFQNHLRQAERGNRFPAIELEKLAIKLASIRNYEYPALLQAIVERPRLTELLCFLQHMSTLPGGLDKFAQDLIGSFLERIGTAKMHEFGPSPQYTLAQCQAVLGEIPECHRGKLRDEQWRLMAELGDSPAEDEAESARVEKEFESNLKRLNRAYFQQLCTDAARSNLAAYLASLINDPSVGFNGVWYWPDIIESIFEAMDRHAKQAAQTLAMTEVAVKVFDALNYACSEKVFVRVEGGSRFGKTEALQTYCNMYPGRARLVTVPCSNSDVDYFKAIAEALGIHCDYRTNAQRLREKLEFIVRYVGLLLVHDEAHFLLPQRFSEHTPPMRLNWLRTQLVDRHNPCAIAVTPQSYGQSIKRYVKKTGYSFEQFLGREAFAVFLPSDLSEKDLFAVVQIHFPEIDRDYQELIVSKALISESYLKAVENIAKRARYLAGRAGRSGIALADIDLAIDQVMPSMIARGPAKAAAAKTESAASGGQKPARMAPARAVQPAVRRPAEATGTEPPEQISRFSDRIGEPVGAPEDAPAFAAG